MEHQIGNKERWKKYDRIIDDLAADNWHNIVHRLIGNMLELCDFLFEAVVDQGLDMTAEQVSPLLLDINGRVIKEIAVEACLVMIGVKEYSTEAWEKLNEIQREDVS